MTEEHDHGGHGAKWRPRPTGKSPCSPFVSLLSVVALLVSVASGCTRTHAKVVPDTPDAPLEVPAPPPRDVEPSDIETPPPAPAAPEPARAAPPPARPRPAPPREQPKPEPPKPEPAPEPPKPAEEPPRNAPTLQTTPPTAEGELERNVRATLDRASNELTHIDYRGLNADARNQYDTAKRFIRQAEAAVRAKNLVFAKNLADKAATIAAQLRAR